MNFNHASDKDISIAKIKADIFTAVISNGSLKQKEHSLATAEEAFKWCTCHVENPAPKIEPPPPTGKTKKG